MGAKKKQRTSAPQAETNSPIRQSLLDDAKALRVQHDANGPYKHIVLHDLCDMERMKQVHLEMTEKPGLNSTFKETDLFKVFQTQELALIENEVKAGTEANEAFQQLLALRSALYSPEFRAFIQEITGCNDLTDRVDCSANVYLPGTHIRLVDTPYHHSTFSTHVLNHTLRLSFALP